MIARLKILVFFGGLLCVFRAGGQDINFSQFYELPMLRNPALAGIFAGDFRISGAYRNQWESVTVPYRTFGVGAEYKKPLGPNSDDFITMGAQATNDVAGDSRLSRSQVLPLLNYHKSVNGGYISAGFMGGAVFQRFDPSKLSFDDQFVSGAYSSSNPTRQVFSNSATMYWDASAGLSFSGMTGEKIHYYLGFGLFHITKPKVAFQKQYDVVLNRKWIINAGFSAAMSETDKLTMYGDYFVQGGSRLGQGGVIYSHDLAESENEKISISGGLLYRWNDAMVPLIKLDYDKLGIGITYDVNTSKLKSASQYRGGFELTLSYKAYRNTDNSTANKVKCPLFY